MRPSAAGSHRCLGEEVGSHPASSRLFPRCVATQPQEKQLYFTLHGNICVSLRAKDHLNIFIYDPLVPDPEGLINQGQGNRTARAIQARQNETINTRALLTLFQAIIANNRAG